MGITDENLRDSSSGVDSRESHETPEELFFRRYGVAPSCERLPGAGSDRVYLRLSAPGVESVVGVAGPDRRENATFISLARAFRARGHNMPEIYAVSADGYSYLLEDLGDVSLLSLLDGPERMRLAGKALESLATLQTEPEELWGPLVSSRPFSRRQIMWDLNYFKYEMLKPCGIIFDEDALEDDFQDLAASLADVPEELQGFMYRDFQSRNIMVSGGRLWLIDFQGGRKGPMVYDAVSFLWQAKARFTPEERMTLFGRYAAAISSIRRVGADRVVRELPLFSLFRTLQVLGAYGFRGLVERKAHFIESIPAALDNLASLLEEGAADRWPELRLACRRLVSSRLASEPPSGRLVVSVFSFSYKRGYPEDLSGNGGGFMFDCRGMHNPGRYERFRNLTGLDSPVVDFLEERGEAKEFVDAAVGIVAPSVATYLRRGFSSLQVGFGCTGGQHRSVYCAESFGRRLKGLFPEAEVHVVHREQSIDVIL